VTTKQKGRKYFWRQVGSLRSKILYTPAARSSAYRHHYRISNLILLAWLLQCVPKTRHV